MYALIVFLFVQNGLDVQIVNTMNYGEFDKAECYRRAVIETHTLPFGHENDAKWQYATYVQVRS